jgi:hypothetical protein
LATVTGFFHPTPSIGVAHEIEEPVQERKPVASTETESCGVRCEGCHEGTGVVMAGSDGIGHDLGHRLGILLIEQKVRCDAERAGDQKTAKLNPLAGLEPTMVEAHVLPSGLLPDWDGELMTVRGQVADTKEGRCGSM